jgi:hypothetical protein
MSSSYPSVNYLLGATAITTNSLLHKKNWIKAQSLHESSFHNHNTANYVNTGNRAPNAHKWASLIGWSLLSPLRSAPIGRNWRPRDFISNSLCGKNSLWGSGSRWETIRYAKSHNPMSSLCGGPLYSCNSKERGPQGCLSLDPASLSWSETKIGSRHRTISYTTECTSPITPTNCTQ